MSENYEYIKNDEQIKYTNTEYPNLYITVEADRYNDLDNKKKVKHAFHRNIGLGNVQMIQPNMYDKVWMNGAHSRTDYNINSTDGQRIKGILDDNFSNITSDLHSTNLISEFAPNRPPYSNNSISLYNMEEASSSIKTTYGCSYTKYYNWYGLKFDLTTKTTSLKIVVDIADTHALSLIDSEAFKKLPRLDSEIGDNGFLAFIHNAEGTISEHTDLYITSSDIHIKQFCDENELTFPYDYSDKAIRDKIWIWGLVFNRNTGVFSHVKAYQRIYT